MIKRLGLLFIPALAAAACSANGTGEPSSTTQTEAVSAAPIQKVTQTTNPYTLFETLQTRPLALSSDGRTLYALNTPDNRLEIFRVDGAHLQSLGSVEVGLEPVAVALRNDGEVWVVNHLSDSVSIVETDDDGNARVARTLLVGDEPRDIVFGGPGKNLAFITTAHRGQTSPDDPDLFTPGVGRADVWVFDAHNLGKDPGGDRVTKLTFFADTPRALAVTPDGKTVYAAAFFSGNQTTSISDTAVSDAYGTLPQIPGGGAGPLVQLPGGAVAPEPNTGLVVKYRNGHWMDAYGVNFDAAVTITLADEDVFAIDATKNPPVAKTSGVYAHVGTTLFNMAVNPRSGKVYVSNTDAHNDVRFEGHTPGFTSVAGNIVDSRISVIDPASGSVTAANLNPHLTHAVPPAIVGSGDPTLSRAFPQDLTFSADGKTVYVVAEGSAKLAIYDTASLESGVAAPTHQNQVNLSGGGPTGVVTDGGGKTAFVLTRFDDGISVVDLKKNVEVSHTTMFSPEPTSVTAGRKFLQSAKDTSALGDQACASCHVGGDFDGLAWDLGNPSTIPLPITPVEYAEASGILEASAAANGGVPTPQAEAEANAVLQNVFAFTAFEVPLSFSFSPQQVEFIMGLYMPTKGPMTTQSLRGLDNHGPMHWRGDRNGAVQQTGVPFLDSSGNPVVSAQPNAGIFDEFNGFKSFNVAFPGLVGDAAQLSDADMSAYATFALQIAYPPNPIRNLDDSLTDVQALGSQVYHQSNPDGSELPIDRIHNCNGCHVLDRGGNAGQSPHPGFFGTNGRLSFEAETQSFKVPHLRNAYQKVGMYSPSVSPGHSLLSVPPFADPTHPVPAVRGFGYNHDGIEGSIEQFLASVVFIQSNVAFAFGPLTLQPNPGGIPFFTDPNNPLTPDPTLAIPLSQQGLAERRGLSSYILAFDTNLFPVVGQQTTLSENNGSAVASRIALFESQAAAGNTDLVARVSLGGIDAGFVWTSGGWQSAFASLPRLTDAQLQDLAAFGPVTYTCVPPGEGYRLGIDRDGDGYADGDERFAHTNPADPNSYPGHR
jgi:DNA-binding beta-propeller fold protein YncE